jgi:hypothetical protein
MADVKDSEMVPVPRELLQNLVDTIKLSQKTGTDWLDELAHSDPPEKQRGKIAQARMLESAQMANGAARDFSAIYVTHRESSPTTFHSAQSKRSPSILTMREVPGGVGMDESLPQDLV